MAQPKLKKISKQAADDYVLQLIAAMLMMMSGNTNFTNTTATLTSIQNLFDEFSAALNVAATKAAGTAAIKNQKKYSLLAAVNLFIDNLNWQAAGDLAKLQSVGLPVSTGLSSPRILGAITKFTAKYGLNSGSIILNIEVENATGAMYSYTSYPSTPASKWVSTPCDTLSCTINNLPVGEKLVFQARATGSNMQSVTSQEISMIIV